MDSNLEIHFTNIRGFKSNFHSIVTHLELTKPAVLSLGEVQVSYLGDPNDFQCPGYSRIDYLVPRRGVILFVRDDLHFNVPKFVLPSSNPAFNTLWIEIKFQSHSIFICSLYRSPNLPHAETCHEFDIISSSIDMIYQISPMSEVVVLGDFNIHNDTWLGFSQPRDQTGEFVELFAGMNSLVQLVDKPTRYPDILGHSSHLLDLFLTTMPDKYSIDVNAPLGLSDHALVSAKFPIFPPASGLITHTPRLIWHYKDADWQSLNLFFSSFDWTACFISNNADIASKHITSVILKGMKLFIPSSYKKNRPHKTQWFNSNCKSAIFEKKCAHLNYLNNPSNDNLIKFRIARNKSNAIIIRSKLNHDLKIRNQIRNVLDSKSNSRTFWSFASLVKRNFSGKASSIPLLFHKNIYYKTTIQKANLLASHFASASTLSFLPNQSPPACTTVSSSMPKIYFRSRVVSKVLKNLSSYKATGPDGLPSIVLKNCHLSLAKPLCKLFKLSMNSGIFPCIWKTANIQPVPKKGDKTSPSNYRPIALLSTLSKVMESIVNFHLMNYLERHALLSDFQYGFRKNRSSGDLIAYLTHLWGKSIEKYGESSVVSLDISKAFDRVWHQCLITKIRSLNLDSSLIQWLESYLMGRSIKVVLDGISSDSHEINAGVPQGSSLSPTLFLIYINDIFTLAPCDIHSFADDTTVSASIEFNSQKDCNSNLSCSRQTMSNSLSTCIDKVIEWGKSNRVEFNPQKFQACLFSQKKTLNYVPPIINGVPINRSSSLRMLGLEISSDLSWKDHIYSIAKKASQYLGFIRRCNFYFTPMEVLKLYKAYVRPIMEFNSFVWGGAPKTNLNCLDRIQNRVIHMINDKNISLSLDSLEHRRKVGALSLFYKYYFGRCSSEIKSLIPASYVSKVATRFGSKQHSFALDIPRCRTNHFKSSFFPRVTSLWNQIDPSVFPTLFNLQVFKRNLNSYLKKLATRED